MDQLSTLQDIYSDMYKDVHGVRPRGGSEEDWNSIAWLSQECDQLEILIKAQLNEQKNREAVAIEEFEKTVANSIEFGAHNRETAIRWVVDAEIGFLDYGHYCFIKGLPFDYLNGE